MRRFTSSLDRVTVATPCPADWDGMIGGDRARFCGQCELNVYDLSGMKRNEAEALITRTEGRLCVRFYRRQDGSIITQDCPVGLRALRRRISRTRRAVVSALLSFLAGIGVTASVGRLESFLLDSDAMWGTFGRTQGVIAGPRPTMGDMVLTDHPVEKIHKTGASRTPKSKSRP